MINNDEADEAKEPNNKQDEREYPGESTSLLNNIIPSNHRHLSTTQEDTSVDIIGRESRESSWFMRNRHFYNLFLFCLLSFLQSAVFVDWNPIANSALAAFTTWSISTLAWQSNLATITCPFLQWPVWKAIEKYPLDKVIKFGAVVPLTLGTLLRTIQLVIPSLEEQILTAMTYSCSFLVGFVGVVFFTSVTKFSNSYFPQEYRSFATGITFMCANLGSVYPALIGPEIVTDPMDFSNSTIIDKDKLKMEINYYLLMFAVMCLLMMILFMIYFPAPNSSESNSQNEGDWQTPNIWRNCFTILKNYNILLLLITHSLSCIPIFWSNSFLTVYLSRLYINQRTVGILITSAVIFSCIVTALTTKIVDKKIVGVKTMLMIMMSLYAISMIALCFVLLNHEFNGSKYVVLISYAISNAIALSLGPHIFGYGSELSRPISEEFVCGLFFQASCFTGAIFYLTFNGSWSLDWVLYLLMLCPSISIFTILPIKQV